MARRPAWVGWIPAAVLLVLIAGVGVTVVLLFRGGIAEPAPAPTAGQVDERNWSVFTEEGVAYIDRTRVPRIDLSNPPVQAGPLGLPADGTLTVGPLDNGDVQLDYRLILNGGGELPGGMSITATQFTLTTADGVLRSIVAPTREAFPFRSVLDDLASRADDFGWQVDEASILATAGDATRAGTPFEFTVGPAERVGMGVAATVSCEGGGCRVAYTVTPRVR